MQNNEADPVTRLEFTMMGESAALAATKLHLALALLFMLSPLIVKVSPPSWVTWVAERVVITGWPAGGVGMLIESEGLGLLEPRRSVAVTCTNVTVPVGIVIMTVGTDVLVT
jgi:hypothetical protein